MFSNRIKSTYRIAKLAFCAVMGLAAATSSQAVVINFDGIGIQDGVTAPGFVDSGFRFSNNADVVDLVGSRWSYGARSGEFAALNDYGGAIEITLAGGGTFSFQDTYIKGWANQGGHVSNIAGYLGSTLVGQVDFIMGSGWQNIAGNFASIDKLVMSGGNHFLVDDLTLNGSSSGPASVPEPATLGIMALGLLGMGALRRKQQQK